MERVKQSETYRIVSNPNSDKTRPDLMKPVILHDLEEVDHGEMALQDYIKLSGDEREARAHRITPKSFAMGATCRMIA